MKIITAFLLAFIAGVLPLQLLHADELTISGNGSESANEVQVSLDNSSNIEQSNDSSITNDISVSSNTGGNSASGNTDGNTDITTGDTATDIAVLNSANTSSVSSGCCPTGSDSISVNGNGTGSQNTANVSQTNTKIISVTNNARISNTLFGTAITGNNSANDNVGNTSIQTGNIFVNQFITTGPLNGAYVSTQNEVDNAKYKVTVFGNGSNSENDVTFLNNSSTLVSVNNTADITNTAIWDLITGNNAAHRNVGDIFIGTGDIASRLTIKNGPINVNSVTVDCCQDKTEKVTPPTGSITTSPNNPSTGGGGPSGANGRGRGGDVLGQSLGNILPATGTNWLFYALIGNMVMFFLGMYLRLRSGRSPGFAFAM